MRLKELDPRYKVKSIACLVSCVLCFMMLEAKAGSVLLKFGDSYKNIGSLSDSAILLPLHEVALHCKIDVQWDAVQEQMTLSKGTTKIKLMIGNQHALVNENVLCHLLSPPAIIGGAIVLSPRDTVNVLSILLPSMDVSFDEAKSTIDIWKSSAQEKGYVPPLQTDTSEGYELLGNFELKTVVIDAGHGGHDPGASRGGVYEKDIVLDIALRLANLIKSQSELKVVLTRDSDEFIPLGLRTSIANRYPANSTLFVCIHVNATRARVGGYGTETYIFDLEATDAEARALAARENQGEEMDLTRILSRCYHIGTEPYSLEIARRVQRSVTEKLGLADRGVRRAPFYVLAGTKMPAILLELAYISNSKEREKLRSVSFRQEAASALFDAIMSFREAVNKSVAKDKTG